MLIMDPGTGYRNQKFTDPLKYKLFNTALN